MRKQLGVVITALFFLISCQKANSPTVQEDQTDEVAVAIQKRSCGTQEVLQAQLAADPSLRDRMNQIEVATQRYVESKEKQRISGATTITIGVVVNVVYRTTAENISDAQIQSQIDVLNEDYSNTNADRSMVPSVFSGVDGNMNIKFVLNRIVRKKTTKKSFSTNDGVKKSSLGGQDPYDPSHLLNMWACNLSQGLLGYAQFPGGNAATDGVVILYSAFGSRAKYAAGTYTTSYDKGRTATHEVGHCLNLRHIWGDATCGSDVVDDTPPHHGANYGCPGTLNITCTNNATTNPYNFNREMTMNYMDYTDDACMYMFTTGQSNRSGALFVAGGAHAGWIQ